MEHSELVRNLKKNGAVILANLTAEECDLTHHGIGVVGEGAELLDAIKKLIIYRRPLDMENVIEELGDLEFFMEGLRQNLGITREQTIEHNIAKLLKRYPKGYSDEAAQTRADKA